MFDFKTKPGCLDYVQRHVLPQVEQAFATHQRCNKFGIAFAKVMNGTTLPEPQPVPVALGPLSGRDARRMMTQVMDQTRALGAVFVRQDEFPMRKKAYEGETLHVTAIVVQLEHKSFADHAWTAYVNQVTRKLDPWLGPFEVKETPIEVRELRFLAARWMS